MQWARGSAKIHKWLALLMAIQIIFWFVSGLFFAVFPIERVRSEHMMAKSEPAPIELAVAAAGLGRLADGGVTQAAKVEVRSLLGRPVALVTQGEGRPRLFDLASATQLSPLPAALAVEVAERDHAGAKTAGSVVMVTKNSPEYRGALPAWRVNFDDGANRALYVAADTGTVTARRSTLWRTFDFLWSLHIMDFKEHEDFNTPLLIVATALSLIVIVTGMIMFPSRLGYHGWRRRRSARKAASP